MTDRIDAVFNILATPFKPEGEIDLPSLRQLVEFQIDKGAYGLTILGVLGEAAKLSVDERRLVMDTVMETVAGRIPVVVGASHVDPATCISLSKTALAGGADGVMIAASPIVDVTDDKVLAFYSDVAASVDGAIVVQDFPPVNNIFMSADLLARIAEAIPNARHLKLEDPPLMQKISAIRERTDQYKIFGGLGGMFFLEELKRGAAGTMTGFAFTEVLVAVYRAFKAGDHRTAERIFDQYLPLIRFENQLIINLPLRKEMLRRRGAIEHAALRRPFAPIDVGSLEEIGWMFERVGITVPTRKLEFHQGVH